MARHCGNCGQQGHYVSTCPNTGKVAQPLPTPVQRVEEKEKSTRICGTCGRVGHNSRTCPSKSIIQTTLPTRATNTIQVGDALLKKGMWIVNNRFKKCAGFITRIKKDGTIIWQDFYGTTIQSTLNTLTISDYVCHDNKPIGNEWVYLHLGRWESNPNVEKIVEEEVVND